MLTGSVKLTGNWDALRNLDLTFGRRNMQRLGEFAVATIKARVAKGIGSDDSPMAPLKGRGKNDRPDYQRWKQRHGLQPIRDLRGSGKDGGHMMDNLSVTSANEETVSIGFTQQAAIGKAAANEKRTPFLSFSNRDQRAILAYALTLWKAQVEVIRRRMEAGQ